MDDNVGNLERYRSYDDNNNFNYDDIDKEILRFKYKDSIGESKTIVFHDYDDNFDAVHSESIDSSPSKIQSDGESSST